MLRGRCRIFQNWRCSKIRDAQEEPGSHIGIPIPLQGIDRCSLFKTQFSSSPTDFSNNGNFGKYISSIFSIFPSFLIRTPRVLISSNISIIFFVNPLIFNILFYRQNITTIRVVQCFDHTIYVSKFKNGMIQLLIQIDMFLAYSRMQMLFHKIKM